MKNINTMKKVIKLLRRYYYGNIISLAVAFLLFIFNLIPLFTDGRAVSITLERYAIMVTIIIIPVSLKFFAYKLKKTTRPLETTIAAERYKNIFFLRLYSISAVALMHIILFAISRNMNFFWFTIVLFIVFFFCKPSYIELEYLTEAPDKEQERQSYPEQQQEEQMAAKEEQEK